MYLCTRISINVPQVYLPLYLTSSLSLNKESIAYYPLTMLVCSVLGSFITRVLTKFAGKRVTYVGGAALVIASSFWFKFQVIVMLIASDLWKFLALIFSFHLRSLTSGYNPRCKTMSTYIF